MYLVNKIQKALNLYSNRILIVGAWSNNGYIVNDLNELEYSLSNQFLLFSFYFSLFSFSNRIMKIG